MRWLKACALALWYALVLFVALFYVRGWERTGIPGAGGWVSWFQSLLGLLILVGLFVLLHLAARALPSLLDAWRPAAETREKAAREGLEFFPSTSTLLVGAWLVVFSLVDLAALLGTFTPPDWITRPPDPGTVMNLLAPMLPGSPANRDQLQDLLVTMFAAGIGSSIAAILGYLEHACIKRDFRRSYVPWYFARPLMGLLLGVIFFFVLKGGLLAVLQPEGAGGGAQAARDLNQFTLAGLGALVGLFSKNALEKLREVFNNLFATERDFAEELRRRLPAETWKQVRQYFVAEHEDGGDDGGAGGGGEPPTEPEDGGS